jgi:hypothetical protein
MNAERKGTHTPGPLSCGCKSVSVEVSTHGGIRHYVAEVHLCPLHKAAPELLAACKRAWQILDERGDHSPTCENEAVHLALVIAKAGGK